MADKITESEWYSEEHKDIFVYFSSWDNLQEKIDTLDYEAKRKYILEFGKKHNDEMLKRWKNALFD